MIDKCDTLSVYDDLKSSGVEEAVAKSITRILDKHYRNTEDDLMNKFKEAQQELLTKIDTKFAAVDTKFDSVATTLNNLDGDVKSLKGGWKDRFTLLLGFATVALAIYFGFHH